MTATIKLYTYFMKINSQQTGRGKLGNTVYSLNGGACIARQKAKTVRNPNTSAQVGTRSKFKLLSQLAAALAPIIAIRKDGLVSGRNQFMTINKNSAQYVGNDASINLNKVQITKSARGVEDFEANRSGGTAVAVNLLNDMSSAIDRMVYSMFKKNADGSLTLFDSKVVSEAGAEGKFPATLNYTATSVVIYAYGVKLTTAASKTAFGNMQAPSAEQVAKLLTTSTEAASGSKLTRTKALTMNEGTNSGSSEADDNFMVSVSASGIGTATGGGRFDAGQACTVVATPGGGSTFVGWKRGSASGEVVSTQASYTFAVESDITLVAVFEGGSVPTYTISASVSPAGSGSVSGAGDKEMGTTCTLVATPASGKVFKRWTENGSTVSTSATYSFTVERNRTLVAVFEDPSVNPWSDVQYGGNDFAADVTATAGSTLSHVTGSVNSQYSSKVGLCKSANAPSKGSLVQMDYGSSSSKTNFDITPLSDQMTAGKYWLCAGRYDDADDEYEVVEVFDHCIIIS